MTRKTNDQNTTPDADVNYVIECSREAIEDIFENIVNLGVKISAEMERNDTAHRGRMNKLRDRFDRQVEEYEKQKKDLRNLQQSRVLSEEDQMLLRLRDRDKTS